MPINNNPFTFKGRMHRVPFAIIVVILKIITFLCAIGMKSMSNDMVQAFNTDGYKIFIGLFAIIFIYVLILTFFNTIKRLRDVKQAPWWSLLILLGPVYIILFIYLIIVPSKWSNDTNNALSP